MENLTVYPHERVDDLQRDNLKIIQNPAKFCFGVDAVLLTHFSASIVRKNDLLLDLCTGSGIVPILMSSKSSAKHITGIEIQPDIADCAQRSILLNCLQDKVNILCGDIKNYKELLGTQKFNVITCNPPYKEVGGGLISPKENDAISRHEILCNLEDVISISSALLTDGGKLCLVHRPERLADIFCLARKYRLEPKRLQMVHPSPKKTANIVLIELAKHGNPKLFLMPPLYVYNENGTYSEEINEIYGRNTKPD